jgi:hypothetical protein
MANCPDCAQLISAAISASRVYHNLVVEQECADIIHHRESLLVSEDVHEADQKRITALLKLTVHRRTHSPYAYADGERQIVAAANA